MGEKGESNRGGYSRESKGRGRCLWNERGRRGVRRRMNWCPRKKISANPVGIQGDVSWDRRNRDLNDSERTCEPDNHLSVQGDSNGKVSHELRNR